MGFMVPIVEQGTWYVVETEQGSCVVPAYALPRSRTHQALEDLSILAPYCEGTPRSAEAKDGFCARLSAPGYLDCTEWCGPYATAKEALDELDQMYGDDDETAAEIARLREETGA